MKGEGELPTKRRRESSTQIYHVIVKGINNEKIFNQQREKVYLKKIILKSLEHFKIEIYCYCIMSNHAHFIIRAEIQVLSLFMATILAEYASYYNYKHHRNGHVFQNRFMSECIENERYFWACLRYIHLNPVKAGMIKNPVRYKYSSMGEYLTEDKVLLHEKAVGFYKKTFKNFEEFEEFHKRREKEIFQDVTDEIRQQQEEIAMLVAEKIFREKELFLITQVFEEKNVREEYILLLKQTLKISQKRAKELCEQALNKVQNE